MNPRLSFVHYEAEICQRSNCSDAAAASAAAAVAVCWADTVFPAYFVVGETGAYVDHSFYSTLKNQLLLPIVTEDI